MRTAALVVALILAAPAVAQERLEEFGYAVPIEFAPGDALYVLRLPEAVYRHAVRADLGDLRVFNGAGESIPYALRQPLPILDKAAPAIRLPQFPVRGSTDRKTSDDLKVEVRRDGTVVSVRAGKGGSENAVTAWLIDASSFEQPIEALELALSGEADVVARVGVDSSGDLKYWNRVVADAPVVRTRFGGERLERLSVPLHGVRAKYLRLVDARGAFSFEVASVSVVRAPETTPPALESLSLGAGAASVVDRAWTYDTGGRFPVARVAFELPEDNTVLPFTLESRANADRPWYAVGSGVAYRLTQGGITVTSPSMPVSATERQLRVRLTSGAGPLPAAAPSLVAQWQPAELVFAARGSPPFTLAYGKTKAEPMRVAIESIVPGYGTRNAMAPKPATAGTERTLAGDAAARVAPDYRRWSLWAVLVVGVLVLAGMGLKLARESASR